MIAAAQAANAARLHQRRCPTATTRSSATAASGSRAASASAWRSPGSSSRTRRSCCSTRRRARSTTSGAARPGGPRPAQGGADDDHRRAPALDDPRAPIGSPSSTTAGWSNSGPRTSCWRPMACTPGSTGPSSASPAELDRDLVERAGGRLGLTPARLRRGRSALRQVRRRVRDRVGGVIDRLLRVVDRITGGRLGLVDRLAGAAVRGPRASWIWFARSWNVACNSFRRASSRLPRASKSRLSMSPRSPAYSSRRSRPVVTEYATAPTAPRTRPVSSPTITSWRSPRWSGRHGAAPGLLCPRPAAVFLARFGDYSR